MGFPSIMKILPVFLLVLFFSGFLIFSYMAWITFRGPETNLLGLGSLNIAGLNYKAKGPNQIFMGDGDQTYPSNNNNNPLITKLKANVDGRDEVSLQGLSTVDEDKVLGADVSRAVQNLKMRVISKLRRHLLNGSKVKGHINQYGVNFTALKPRSKLDREEIMCRIQKIKFDILNENSSPLLRGKTFPTESLFFNGFQHLLQRQQGSFEGSVGDIMGDPTARMSLDQPLYRSCAVIPNSAALDGAKHGLDIDSHEFILRFNNAPTQGFEEDVGRLTSMRVVNSQVVTNPRFKFPYSSMYPTDASSTNSSNSTSRNESTLAREKDAKSDILWAQSRKYLIWDPCNHSATFEQWYYKPDFPFFEKYFNLTNRSEEDRNRYYIMNCRVIWKLWELLQEFTFARIYGNPPTSGFIGIFLALQMCERVNVYEYIPSVRESERCHYYGPKNDSNPSCTYGSWHPVSAEKLFFLSISDGTDKQIFFDGVLTIPGSSQFKC